MKPKTGLLFAGVYILVAVYLIATQGLFGESFIALILGLPWSLLPAFFEYGGGSSILTYVFIFGPLIVNTVFLYWIGSLIGRSLFKAKPESTTQTQ